MTRGRPRREVRHGTVSGYRRHQENDEEPCPPCRAAKTEFDARWRSAPERTRLNRLYARAQQRAFKKLRERHQREYDALYDACKIELYREHGLPVRYRTAGDAP